MAAEYAFVGWICSIMGYVVFLIWAFTPESVLHHYGITYYPSRYYAIALPSYLLVTIILGGFLYMGLNMAITFKPDDMRTVEDSQTIRGPNEFIKLNHRNNINHFSVPDVSDMDPTAVSTLLLQSIDD